MIKVMPLIPNAKGIRKSMNDLKKLIKIINDKREKLSGEKMTEEINPFFIEKVEKLAKEIHNPYTHKEYELAWRLIKAGYIHKSKVLEMVEPCWKCLKYSTILGYCHDCKSLGIVLKEELPKIK